MLAHIRIAGLLARPLLLPDCYEIPKSSPLKPKPPNLISKSCNYISHWMIVCSHHSSIIWKSAIAMEKAIYIFVAASKLGRA